MARVYLSLGANLGDRLATLWAALAGLQQVGTLEHCSSVYETEPWGVPDQPRFLNLCCALETDLPPLDLLERTQALEAQLGRRPGPRWGPRPLDVDLLSYDQQQLHTDRLTLPHPRLSERVFVLVPLAEIAPALWLPGLDATVADLLRGLPAWADQVRLEAPPPPLRRGCSGHAPRQGSGR